jgi:UDP-glucose 4-epimerase
MSLSNKRILVTGGAGFIGSTLVRKLVENANEVYVLDNLSSGYESNVMLNESVKFYNGDVRDESLVANLVKESDVIFHLAEFIPNTEKYGVGHVVKFSVENPLAEFDVSCRGTLTVLEKAKEYKRRLIFASTAAVYGEANTAYIKEVHETLPISPYGASKLCAETYVKLYQRIYELPTTILRFFNVYGPKQRKYVMYDILRKLAINPYELQVLGTGYEERDFIYVDDVIDALLMVAENEDTAGQIFNVGSGEATSLRDLVKTMMEVLVLNPQIVFTNSSWKGNVRRLCADITRISELGFKPKYQLRAGIKSLTNWFFSPHKTDCQNT